MIPVEDKPDKRRQLLETAEALFSKHGFEAVSIRQIAAEAGSNIAMVSYYFGSKEKLFEAVIDNKLPLMRERLEKLALEPLTPWQKLVQTIDIYVDKMFSSRNFNRTMLREMSLEQRPDHLRLISSHLKNNMQIIIGFIREGQERGQFRYVDPELTLTTLIGTIVMVVNSPVLISSLVGENTPDKLFEEPFKARVKTHIKSVMQAHLMK